MFSRLFSKRFAPHAAPATAFQPRLEGLEDRLTPATMSFQQQFNAIVQQVTSTLTAEVNAALKADSAFLSQLQTVDRMLLTEILAIDTFFMSMGTHASPSEPMMHHQGNMMHGTGMM